MGMSAWARWSSALTLGIALASVGGQAWASGPAWVGSWASSQQIPEPQNAAPADDLKDATLRQVVHLSIGGARIRIRLSNTFGTAPLHVTAVHAARAPKAGAAGIDPSSDRAVTFGGRPDVIIPAGAEYLSDPVELEVAPLSSLAVSLHLDAAPMGQTGHPGSRATSYFVHGDRTAAADLPGAKTLEHWFQVSGVEVEAAQGAGAIVALGDSITDGHGTTTNGDDRWTDDLAKRLHAAGTEVAVLNEGIGGNHLLTDGLGPNALSRFDRDVLAQAGARWLIVLEGINDIGGLSRSAPNAPQAEHDLLVARMIDAYRQFIAKAHAHGIEAIGATITPFMGSDYYHPGAANEADRQAVNRWIRTSGAFDQVVDFDAAIRDPSAPDRMTAAYDSGDHLHPSPAGYRAMAAAIPLELFGGQPGAGPEIAITFDDLPAHAALPQGETRLEIAQKIIGALEAAGVPEVYGFVNGVQIEREPASAAVLPAWRQAGFPLANHTWTHLNLNTYPAAAWEAEVAQSEPLLKAQMGEGDWRWLRFPFLSEGETPQKKVEVRKYLAGHGYKIAAVTMSFGDYAFNDPYARCVAKGDAKAIAELEAQWLDAAEKSIGYYRGLSHSLYGRDIPYVLLMHLGALDAKLLPKLLAMYQAHGFRFVTLPEAEKDAFYRADVDPSLPPEPVNLETAMAAKGQRPPASGIDLSNLDQVCR